MVQYPELVSFILRAKNRRIILLTLEKEEKFPTAIVKETSMYKSHVSRTLQELEQKKLVQCRNPKDRSYRFYTITDLGKIVLKEVKRQSFS